MFLYFLVFSAGNPFANGADPLLIIQNLRALKQFGQAKTILDQMISQKGKNAEVLLYRLRSECFVNIDMPEEALEDIEVAFRKSPPAEEITNLHLLAATAYIQLGDSEQAEIEAESAGDPNMIKQTKELKSLLDKADELIDEEKYAETAKIYDKILPACTHATNIIQKRLDIAWILGQTKIYEERAKALVEVFRDDSELQFRYGVSLMCNGKFTDGKRILTKVKNMDDPPGNLSVYNDVANRGGGFLTGIQNSIDKSRLDEAKEQLDKFNETVGLICSPNSGIMARANYILAKICIKKGMVEEAIELLNKAIENDQENFDFILYRAEILMQNKDYDAAIFDYNRLQRMKPNDSSINRALKKAQDAKKIEQQVDYYAVLGVPKGCTASQIKDAYRLLVRKWHPDRYPDKVEKREAEAKMKQINTAYDILNDSEKRKYYDAGGDLEHYQPGAGNMQQGSDPFDILRKMQQGGGGAQGGQQFFVFNQGGQGGAQGGQQFFVFQ